MTRRHPPEQEIVLDRSNKRQKRSTPGQRRRRQAAKVEAMNPRQANTAPALSARVVNEAFHA
jgi:hypothetical protein